MSVLLNHAEFTYCGTGRTAVQPTRHWAIADYFHRTLKNVLLLRRVLRTWHICDIYDDLFVPFIIYSLTYLLTGEWFEAM